MAHDGRGLGVSVEEKIAHGWVRLPTRAGLVTASGSAHGPGTPIAEL
jgi:hypothetical protein